MNIYNLKGDIIGEMQLDDALFAIEPNKALIHELVVAELAGARQGTASTKNRGEVRGGGRKPRRQKGTGTARQGSIRSPQWVGGGVVHGPRPEKDFTKKINKKARILAIKSILSTKAKDGEIFVLGDYSIEKPKTRVVKDFMEKLSLNKTLFLIDNVFDEKNENLYYSARNVKDSEIIDTFELAAYWLLKYKNLVLTPDALEKLGEVLK